MTAIDELQEKCAVPDNVSIRKGEGGLPKLVVETEHSTAEIYLHGAHVTHFQNKGESPLLFLSRRSRFEEGKAIRGGIPVIFPWFGPREGSPQHGFARLHTWDLVEVKKTPDDGVRILMRLPEEAFSKEYEDFECEYIIRVDDTLRLELNIWDESKERSVEFESCLHSYFLVGDIDSISIAGLKYMAYLDQVDRGAEKFERADSVQIDRETDRIYLDAVTDTQIIDPTLGRRILVEKRGSASTVLWNPWQEKSQELPDLADDEYKKFVCVETGNVSQNRLRLVPGETATMNLQLSTARL